MKHFFFLLTILSLSTLNTNATHIIGGEMSYTCTGTGTYDFTLKVYRDCFNGVPPLDNPAYISIFDGYGTLLNVADVYLATDSILNVIPNCATVLSSQICIEEGTYLFSLSLAPEPGSFHIVYQRCCRINTLTNVLDPTNTGMTIFCTIDNSLTVPCNSSPAFLNYPPVVFCTSVPIIFDHSAIEPDGDSLSYQLCAPYLGATLADPQPYPASFPPYDTVHYNWPYSGEYPMDANPPLAIDSLTGLMTGTPSAIGYYAVAVCVKEYRNGILVSETLRDLPVFTVPIIVSASFSPEENFLSIFPDPATGFIEVNVAEMIGPTEFSVYDFYGREVFKKNILLNGSTTENISLENISEGMYELIATNHSEIRFGKFVKMRE